MRLIQLIDLFFRVCEVYDNQMIGHCFRHTKNGIQPRFTDAEVITCYLFATGWQKCAGPKACYDYIATHYLDCFPLLPANQSFNHRLNRLAEVLPLFTQACFTAWANLVSSLPSTTVVTDSFPVITAAGNQRPSNCTLIGNKGRCASKGLWFHGVKVHLGGLEQALTLPIPAYLIIAPASVNDKTAQEDELRQMQNTCVVADKAYVDEGLSREMAENYSQLLTPPRYGRGTSELDKRLDGPAFQLEQRLLSGLR